MKELTVMLCYEKQTIVKHETLSFLCSQPFFRENSQGGRKEGRKGALRARHQSLALCARHAKRLFACSQALKRSVSFTSGRMGGGFHMKGAGMLVGKSGHGPGFFFYP